MKIETNFSFTLFKDKKTNNLFAIGKNAYYQKFFLKPKTNSFNSELIEINEEIFNAFFLCENLEIKNDFNQNIVINTKN
jgi:hypothetical protein